MNKKINILICFCSFALLALQGKAWAVETTTDSFVMNPFMPQIPRKEVIVEPVAPTTPNPTPTEKETTKTIETIKKETLEPKKEKPPEIVKEEPTTPPPAMTITGVLWNSKRPQAIIDGQVVSEGETFKGEMVLKKVSKSSIKFLYKGKNWEIKL